MKILNPNSDFEEMFKFSLNQIFVYFTKYLIEIKLNFTPNLRNRFLIKNFSDPACYLIVSGNFFLILLSKYIFYLIFIWRVIFGYWKTSHNDLLFRKDKTKLKKENINASF